MLEMLVRAVLLLISVEQTDLCNYEYEKIIILSWMDRQHASEYT